MPSGLVALLDDISVIAKLAAASLDDVGAGVAKAGSKAAGVVIDDAAVTPSYVTQFTPDRELPIIAKIARGSLINKLAVLLPAALILSQFLPQAITPLLMLGGLYLSFEGAEKLLEKFGDDKHGETLDDPIADLAEFERQRVAGAVRTVVARGDDHDHVLRQRPPHGVGQGRIRPGRGVLRDVDDRGPGVHRPAYRDGQRVRGPAALVVVLPDGDDLGLRRQADQTGTRLRPGRDDARDLGAVADRIVGAVPGRVDEVHAVVGVHRAGQLRIACVDAGVDDGDPHAPAAGGPPQLGEQQPPQPPRRLGYPRGGKGARALPGEHDPRVRYRSGERGKGSEHREHRDHTPDGAGRAPAGPRAAHHPWVRRASPVSSAGPADRNADHAAGT